jgi:uncharacterized DUF497 family protein
MYIYYDSAKSDWNERERGLSFDRVRDFDFGSALIAMDDRRDYGEIRYVAIGLIGGRLHVLCFTDAMGGIRVISLRKANAREVKRYAQTQTTR